MSTHNQEAKTRTGQKVLQYLKDHPDEMSPTRISRVTGCDRETARHYLRRHQTARGASPKSAAEPSSPAAAESAATPPEPVAEPVAESATPGGEGRSFEGDFPRRKPASVAPRRSSRTDAKPTPPPADVAEIVDAPEDLDDDAEWVL